MTGVGLRALLGLVWHPELWLTAAVVGWRLAAPGWWRQWPLRVRPTEPYGRFRMQTFFGTEVPSRLGAADLVAYLRWCRRMAGWAR